MTLPAEVTTALEAITSNTTPCEVSNLLKAARVADSAVPSKQTLAFASPDVRAVSSARVLVVWFGFHCGGVVCGRGGLFDRSLPVLPPWLWRFGRFKWRPSCGCCGQPRSSSGPSRA